MLIAFLQYKCILDGSLAYFNEYNDGLVLEYDYYESPTAQEQYFCADLLGHQFTLYLLVGTDKYTAAYGATFYLHGSVVTACSSSVCADYATVRSLTYEFHFNDLNVSLDGSVGQYSIKSFDYASCWSYLRAKYLLGVQNAYLELFLTPERCLHQAFSDPPSLRLFINAKPVISFILNSTGNIFEDNQRLLFDCYSDYQCITMVKQWVDQPFFNAEIVLSVPFTAVLNGVLINFEQNFEQHLTELHPVFEEDCISDVGVEFYEEAIHVRYYKGAQQFCSKALIEQASGTSDRIVMRISVAYNTDLSGFRFNQEVDVHFDEFAEFSGLIRCSYLADSEECLENIQHVYQLAENHSTTLEFLFYKAGDILYKISYKIANTQQCNIGIYIAAYPTHIACNYSLKDSCASATARYLVLRINLKSGKEIKLSYEGPSAQVYEFPVETTFYSDIQLNREFVFATLIDGDLETTTYRLELYLQATQFYYGAAVFAAAQLVVFCYILILGKNKV